MGRGKCGIAPGHLVLRDAASERPLVCEPESALGPTQVYGKFLSSAAAQYYIHDADGGGAVAKADEVAFVQVMDTSDLKPRSSKRDQWRNIEASIRSLPTLGSIRHYHLLHADENDFTPGQPVAVSFAECVTTAIVGTARLR